MKEKKYEFDPTKTKWEDINYYIQDTLLDRIKEEKAIGSHVEEMSNYLSFTSRVLFVLSCKKDDFLEK